MTTLKSAPGSGAGILSIGPGAIAVVAIERDAKDVEIAVVVVFIAGRDRADRMCGAWRS